MFEKMKRGFWYEDQFFFPYLTKKKGVICVEYITVCVGLRCLIMYQVPPSSNIPSFSPCLVSENEEIMKQWMVFNRSTDIRSKLLFSHLLLSCTSNIAIPRKQMGSGVNCLHSSYKSYLCSPYTARWPSVISSPRWKNGWPETGQRSVGF